MTDTALSPHAATGRGLPLAGAPAASETLLEARDLVVRFGGVVALNGASLTIPRQGITGIVGPNGAGKSTLFDVLAGVRRPSAGAVHFNGRDITGAALHRRAHLGIARSFQIARELDGLSVLENVLLASLDHPGDKLWRVFLTPWQVKREEARLIERALALLDRVKLRRLADEPAGVLSGGQKKLLELARALMLDPALVLLDEPAAGVNPLLIDELCAFILTLKAEGTAFAIVEHNMDVVAALCDRVYVLADGAVLTTGTFDEIVADARVMDAYLGQQA